MGAAPLLTILRDGEALKSLPLEGEAMLGRSEGCVIRLEDRAISRQHALLRPIPEGGVQIERRSEFAPMKFNGAECTHAIMKEGDVVEIGPYLLRLSAPKAEAAALNAMREVAAGIAAQPSSEPAQYGSPGGIEVPGVGSDPLLQAQAEQPFAQTENSAGAISVLDSMNPMSPPAQAPEEVVAGPLGVVQGAAQGIEGGAAPEGALDFGIGGVDAIAPAVPDIGLGSPLAMSEGMPPGGEFAQPAVTPAVAEDAPTQVLSGEQVEVKFLIPPGVANVTEFPFSGEQVVIGRGKSCDIILKDKKCSRKNTLIRREAGRFLIQDLGSSNGTYLNGVKLEAETTLDSGAKIKIGEAEIEFIASSSEYEAKKNDFLVVPAEPVPDLGSASLMMGQGMVDQGPVDLGMVDVAGAISPIPDYLPQDPPGGFQPSQFPPGQMAGGGIPGMGGGIAGIPDPAQGPAPKSLIGKGLAWLRRQPKQRQFIVVFLVICGLYFFLFDDEEEVKQTAKRPAIAQKADSAQKKDGDKAKPAEAKTFDSLTPEQKKFVEAQHALAFEHFKNREFDKALFEIRKIFELVNNYKDARDIERYSLEGKRKLEQMEEERKRREDQAKLRAQKAQLMAEAAILMAKKDYVRARELLPQIVALDPDDKQVEAWLQQIKDWEQEQAQEQQRKMVQAEVARQGWKVFGEGMAFKKKGQLASAIAAFKKALEFSPGDKKLAASSRKQIALVRAEIAALRDPLLEEGKQAEAAGEFAHAYQAYEKASHIDPSHPLPPEGMARVRGVLHDRAKVLYTEAVMAESYSDFAAARKGFEDILKTAPRDDIYYERAERKLARYLKKEDGSASP